MKLKLKYSVMYYIFVLLQVLSANADWFIIKAGDLLKVDAQYAYREGFCYGNFKLTNIRDTKAYLTQYKDANCGCGSTCEVSGEGDLDGERVSDPYKKAEEYYFHQVGYSDDECTQEESVHVFMPNECCNVIIPNDGRATVPVYYSYSGNVISACAWSEDDPRYDPEKCGTEVPTCNSGVRVGMCRNGLRYYVNYEKFENGVRPMMVMVLFALLVVFL